METFIIKVSEVLIVAVLVLIVVIALNPPTEVCVPMRNYEQVNR